MKDLGLSVSISCDLSDREILFLVVITICCVPTDRWMSEAGLYDE